MNHPETETRGRGRPRGSPENATSQLAIRLNATDREKVRALAERNGVSISAYVVGVLRAHMLEEDV